VILAVGQPKGTITVRPFERKNNCEEAVDSLPQRVFVTGAAQIRRAVYSGLKRSGIGVCLVRGSAAAVIFPMAEGWVTIRF
jgi:hypothetical protein